MESRENRFEFSFKGNVLEIAQWWNISIEKAWIGKNEIRSCLMLQSDYIFYCLLSGDNEKIIYLPGPTFPGPLEPPPAPPPANDFTIR